MKYMFLYMLFNKFICFVSYYLRCVCKRKLSYILFETLDPFSVVDKLHGSLHKFL